MNLSQIRASNNAAIRKYERFGTKIFRIALEKQAEQFDPLIMQDAYIRFYQQVFVDAAKREYIQIRRLSVATKAIGIPDSFFLSTWRAWIKTWAETNIQDIIAGVNQVTFEKIRAITAQGIQDGLNPFQLAKLLKSEIGSKSRALAIARTEGTSATNMGTKRSADDWEMESGERLYKIWIHSGNPNDPRPAHVQAQGKPIPKSQKFIINGIAMDFPGDKSAPASENISCLCTHTYLSERLARKRYPQAFG